MENKYDRNTMRDALKEILCCTYDGMLYCDRCELRRDCTPFFTADNKRLLAAARKAYAYKIKRCTKIERKLLNQYAEIAAKYTKRKGTVV